MEVTVYIVRCADGSTIPVSPNRRLRRGFGSIMKASSTATPRRGGLWNWCSRKPMTASLTPSSANAALRPQLNESDADADLVDAIAPYVLVFGHRARNIIGDLSRFLRRTSD